MNQVILSGRLTKEVQCNYTPSTQMAVARFSVALDRGKDKEGNSRGADFPNIVAFGKTAENLERFSGKGLRVSVIGHLQTGSYEKDGHKVYTTDVIADKIEFIDWKQSNNSGTQPTEPTPEGFEYMTEDIPF